jgi:EPS-associated MarR family transcriptional regulator
MTSRQAKLQEDTNFRLMKLLQDKPDLSQRALAKELGISFGGLNYCLNALKDKGLVKMQNFSRSNNKLGYVYLLTPTGVAEKAALAGRFLKRKMQEYEALKAEIAALRSDGDVGSEVEGESESEGEFKAKGGDRSGGA